LRLRGHRKQGYGISWSTLQTGLLVSGSDDKMIGVYDINATPVLHSKDSSELRSLASSHESGVEPLLMLSGHSDVVEDVCCSLHSAHEFLSCSDDGTIRMWVRRRCRVVDVFISCLTRGVAGLSRSHHSIGRIG
jgi:histone-binding protein RBBP4